MRGDIAFNNVGVAYSNNHPILQNIQLHIPARATVAIVGKSGSGKSTLCKLIPRFYDPVEGYVSSDGNDIRNFRLQSLRQQIGFAMQGSTLFQGTILENITCERDIPMRYVEDATKAAYIHEPISALLNGYETVVGEQGVQLSEGQRQRLALALSTSQMISIHFFLFVRISVKNFLYLIVKLV